MPSTCAAVFALTSTMVALTGCRPPSSSGPLPLTFVVSLLEAPEPYDDGPDRYAVGFDLDDIVSDGAGDDCDSMVLDRASPVSGDPGIDNQLGSALYIVGGADPFPDAVRDGDILLVVEVTADSTVNDGSASVRVSLAARPGPPCDGASPSCAPEARCPAHADVAAPSACGPILDATGSIAPRQHFTVERELATVPARITNRRLSFELLELPIVLFGADGTPCLSAMCASLPTSLTAGSCTGRSVPRSTSPS